MLQWRNDEAWTCSDFCSADKAGAVGRPWLRTPGTVAQIGVALCEPGGPPAGGEFSNTPNLSESRETRGGAPIGCAQDLWPRLVGLGRTPLEREGRQAGGMPTLFCREIPFRQAQGLAVRRTQARGLRSRKKSCIPSRKPSTSLGPSGPSTSVRRAQGLRRAHQPVAPAKSCNPSRKSPPLSPHGWTGLTTSAHLLCGLFA